MKKIIAAVLAVIIIAGACYLRLRPHGTHGVTISNQGVPSTFGGYIKDGGSYVCSIQTIPSIALGGTVYMDHGRIRANFVTKSQSGTHLETHVILRDHTGYTWTSLSTIGYEKPLPPKADPSVGFDGWDPSQVASFACQSWTVDEEEFDLPPVVTFQTIH